MGRICRERHCEEGEGKGEKGERAQGSDGESIRESDATRGIIVAHMQ